MHNSYGNGNIFGPILTWFPQNISYRTMEYYIRIVNVYDPTQSYLISLFSMGLIMVLRQYNFDTHTILAIAMYSRILFHPNYNDIPYSFGDDWVLHYSVTGSWLLGNCDYVLARVDSARGDIPDRLVLKEKLRPIRRDGMYRKWGNASRSSPES